MKRYFLAAAIMFASVFLIASAASAAYNSSVANTSQPATKSAKNIGATTGRDCNSNAVIRCGVLSNSELSQGYRNSGTAAIYGFFGITGQDVNNTWSQAEYGTVTRGGKVIVDGGTVATNAVTAGRQYIPGSKAVTSGGTTFYMRSPKVSFKAQSLPAEVIMRDGRFAYAIILSCGNPVMATPVRPPATTSAPSAPTQIQNQSQTQTVTVNTPQPQVQAIQTEQPAPVAPTATTSLPNTGPGNVLGISGIATVVGSVGHYLYRRRQNS